MGAAATFVVGGCSGGSDGDAAPTSTVPDRTTTTPPVPPLPERPFTLGVASGDPDAESVVLWTRLLPAPPEDVPVVWEVATDERFDEVVAAGVEVARPAQGHAVHAVAAGLEAATPYWYRFRAGDHETAPARTRTMPAGEADRFRFAFASCQDRRDGDWPAVAHLAEEDVDLVVWLGDYIYEGPHDEDGSPEATALPEYRQRYALYKGDTRLQAAHAMAPWLVVWDDHEVENDYAGILPQDAADAGTFAARRLDAYQAWWEHQPTRLPPPNGPDHPINRAVRAGDLVAFFAIDGRQHRSDQPCGGGLGGDCDERHDETRTMLGVEQERWVADELPASSATWNVVANQTVFSPSELVFGPTTIINHDQWDGYPAARRRMLDVLAETSNPIVVTGDIHASAVNDFHRDPADQASPIVGTELVGTSISSEFPADLVQVFESAARVAGAKMADAAHRGYVVCEVTPDELRADYRVVESVAVPESPISTSSSWVVEAGTPGARPA